jgi:hypothetical protein
MRTHECDHMSVEEFEDWRARAKPDDKVTYAHGFLAQAVGLAKGEEKKALEQLQRVTWAAMSAGYLHLTQRRLEPGKYEYIATAAANGRT